MNMESTDRSNLSQEYQDNMRYIEEKLAQLDQSKKQNSKVQSQRKEKRHEPPHQSPQVLVPHSLSATQSASMREVDHQFGQMLQEYKTQQKISYNDLKQPIKQDKQWDRRLRTWMQSWDETQSYQEGVKPTDAKDQKESAQSLFQPATVDKPIFVPTDLTSSNPSAELLLGAQKQHSRQMTQNLESNYAQFLQKNVERNDQYFDCLKARTYYREQGNSDLPCQKKLEFEAERASRNQNAVQTSVKNSKHFEQEFRLNLKVPDKQVEKTQKRSTSAPMRETLSHEESYRFITFQPADSSDRFPRKNEKLRQLYMSFNQTADKLKVGYTEDPPKTLAVQYKLTKRGMRRTYKRSKSSNIVIVNKQSRIQSSLTQYPKPAENEFYFASTKIQTLASSQAQIETVVEAPPKVTKSRAVGTDRSRFDTDLSFYHPRSSLVNQPTQVTVRDAVNPKPDENTQEIKDAIQQLQTQISQLQHQSTVKTEKQPLQLTGQIFEFQVQPKDDDLKQSQEEASNRESYTQDYYQEEEQDYYYDDQMQSELNQSNNVLQVLNQEGQQHVRIRDDNAPVMQGTSEFPCGLQQHQFGNYDHYNMEIQQNHQQDLYQHQMSAILEGSQEGFVAINDQNAYSPCYNANIPDNEIYADPVPPGLSNSNHQLSSTLRNLTSIDENVILKGNSTLSNQNTYYHDTIDHGRPPSVHTEQSQQKMIYRTMTTCQDVEAPRNVEYQSSFMKEKFSFCAHIETQTEAVKVEKEVQVSLPDQNKQTPHTVVQEQSQEREDQRAEEISRNLENYTNQVRNEDIIRKFEPQVSMNMQNFVSFANDMIHREEERKVSQTQNPLRIPSSNVTSQLEDIDLKIQNLNKYEPSRVDQLYSRLMEKTDPAKWTRNSSKMNTQRQADTTHRSTKSVQMKVQSVKTTPREATYKRHNPAFPYKFNHILTKSRSSYRGDDSKSVQLPTPQNIHHQIEELSPKFTPTEQQFRYNHLVNEAKSQDPVTKDFQDAQTQQWRSKYAREYTQYMSKLEEYQKRQSLVFSAAQTPQELSHSNTQLAFNQTNIMKPPSGAPSSRVVSFRTNNNQKKSHLSRKSSSNKQSMNSLLSESQSLIKLIRIQQKESTTHVQK